MPLLVAGSTMAAPAFLFSGLLAAMTGVSGFFWNARVANIKGQSFKLKWIIDPSGYVYDVVTNEKIEDASVTAYWIPYDDTDDFWKRKPSKDTYGIKWDASEYEQINPMQTNIDGKYAWDVPEGWWRVKCEKEGYETYWTDWMTVPPVQTEVNIGLKKLGDVSEQKTEKPSTEVSGSKTNSNGTLSNVSKKVEKKTESVRKPTKVKAFKANGLKRALKLTWKKVSGVAGYEIQYSTKSNFKSVKKIRITNGKTVSKKIKGLKKKRKYYVRIRAYKKNGKNKVYGSWVKIKKSTR